MKPNEECTEYFHGMVKYGGSSGSIGSVKWKMGTIAIDKTDERGWKIMMMFDCSDNPVLSCPVGYCSSHPRNCWYCTVHVSIHTHFCPIYAIVHLWPLNAPNTGIIVRNSAARW